MAFVVADRVKVTVSAPGSTQSITLGSAVTGFQNFSVIGDGNTTYYTIADQSGNNWEVGVGTYTSSGTLLSRDTVLANSAGTTSRINFSSGTQDVFVTYPAGRSIYGGAGGAIVVNQTTVNESYTIGSGTNGISVGPITIASGKSVTVSGNQKWFVAGTSSTGGGGGPAYATYTFTGDGSTTSFDTTVTGLTVNNILAIENGITQVPTTDYTISGTSVVFTTAPASGVAIQIRVLGGATGSGSGLNSVVAALIFS